MFILVNGHKEIETDSEKAIFKKFKEILLSKRAESVCILVNMDNAAPVPTDKPENRRNGLLPDVPKKRVRGVQKQKGKK